MSADVTEGASDTAYCEQRTDAAPPGLEALLEDWDAAACELRATRAIPVQSAARSTSRQSASAVNPGAGKCLT